MHMTQHRAMLSFARGTTDAWGMAHVETSWATEIFHPKIPKMEDGSFSPSKSQEAGPRGRY